MLHKSVILLFIMLMPRILFSASAAIFITDLSDYPEIHANIYFLDDNGVPIYDVSENDIEIRENGQSVVISDFSCSANSNPIEISSILSVDVSASMTSEKINKAKDALNLWIQNLPNGSEASISSFNKHNYMLRDFTSDKNVLSGSLKFINGNGGTDFDNAFFGQPAGIFLSAQKAKKSPVIVIYTDGEGTADYQKIISEAKKIDAKVYSFITSKEIPVFLDEISKQTDGKTFGISIENNDVENAYKYILADAQKYNPCSISWISESCSSEKEIEIQVNTKGISQRLKFSVPEDLLPGFEYPISNTIDFGEVPQGNSTQRNIRIKALRENIIIDTIISNNQDFKIDLGTKENPLTINKGTIEELAIIYTANTENYSYSKFEIQSQACVNNTFYAVAGGKSPTVKDSLLKIVFPNGNESLIAGTDTLITWEGVSANDTVAIEYTSNGVDWNLVSQYADGLEYRWRVPFDISNNCRIRLRHTNSSIESGGNYIIDAHSKSINKVVWGRNDFDTLYTASKDGTLKKWYYKYKKESLILTGQINVSDITQNSGGMIGTISFDQRAKIYKISNSELSADNGHVSGINTIDWSRDERFIIGGSNDGHILVWKRFDNFKEIASEKIHNSKIVDLCWNTGSNKIASCDEDGNLIVSELVLESGTYILKEVVVFPKYSYPINAIEWISDEKIAVAANNKEIKIWDINQQTLPVSYLRNDIEENILDLDYNINQKILGTASNINGVRLFDLSQNRTSYQPYLKYDGHSSQVTTLDIRFDGSVVASADASGELHIWKIIKDNNDYIALQDDVSDLPFSIVKANLNIDDIDLGKQLKGYSTDTLLTAYISNTNSFPIKIDSISIIGENKGLFALQKKYQDAVINPGESLSVLLESTNSTSGIFNADIVVYYHSQSSNANIAVNVLEDELVINDAYHFIGQANIDTTVTKIIALFTNESNKEVDIKSTNLFGSNTKNFTIKNVSDTKLSPQETLYASVMFQPEGTGLLSSGIKIKTDYFDKDIVILIGGEGTAPQIEVPSLFQFQDIICDNVATDSLLLKNKGSGVLVIKDLVFGNKSFSSNSDLYLIIPPKDSLKIDLSFESNVIGGHNDILEIITNLNENNTSSFEVDLTAQKDSSSIFLEKSTLEYSELDENESKTLNVKVHNKGTIDIEWNLPLETSNFEVTSINPITTKAGDSSIFEIKFKGGIEDQSPYNEKITLTDICGKKYNLNLIATIGSNNAKIENIDDLVLPTIVCEETNEYSFDIKNIGTTPLVISEIGFDIKDNNFAFKNDYTGLIIKSGETEKLKITYNAETAGKYSNIINLKTNAVNVNNGEVSIKIRYSKEIVLLGTSVSSIELDGLIQDQEKQVEIQITNNGTKDIEFLSFSSLNRFNLINPPSDIKVGETKDLLVKFTGGNLGITYNEELYIYDDCSNAKRITLSASVNKIPNAKLEISSASAYPGQTFLLPIKLILEEDIDISEDVSASFILNFNKSIMMPLTQHISSIDSSRKNVMIENILLKDLMEGTNLEFKAYLGDTNYTDIKVSNINIENSDELLISGKDGDFTLLGVCRDGGNRFIIDTGEFQLFQNYPNPVYTSSRISFFAIETGNHRVDIYDTYGTKLREVFNKNVSPGLYEVSFDANDLPSGSYIYILQTPSVTIKRKLQVLR